MIATIKAQHERTADRVGVSPRVSLPLRTGVGVVNSEIDTSDFSVVVWVEAEVVVDPLEGASVAVRARVVVVKVVVGALEGEPVVMGVLEGGLVELDVVVVDGLEGGLVALVVTVVDVLEGVPVASNAVVVVAEAVETALEDPLVAVELGVYSV